MGIVDRFFKYQDRYEERKEHVLHYNMALKTLENYVDTYAAILRPLLGPKELARRLIYRLESEAEEYGLELLKKDLEEMYRELAENFVESNGKSFLETVNYASVLDATPYEQEVEAFLEIIEKIEKLIKDEEKYSKQERLLSKREMKGLLKLVENVMLKEKKKSLDILRDSEKFEKEMEAGKHKWTRPLEATGRFFNRVFPSKDYSSDSFLCALDKLVKRLKNDDKYLDEQEAWK
ncbi:MAG: hypothetical protein NT120_04580 [Candidatus Aenigmarchaeota archaeon]|nr:hypothetical protein [Candidatus Aenigmarchaeota archaeon]